MATRLSIITTRGGDDGSTGLGDGSRVPKDDLRIDAMGEVDELNSVFGLLRSESLPADIDALLARIQHHLFDVGAELCIPGHVAVREDQLAALDAAIAHYNADLGKLEEFILPGGSRAASLAHLARSVCRRAERAVVALERRDSVRQAETAPGDTGASGNTAAPGNTATPTPGNEAASPAGLPRRYLNRLSDLCFVLARALNRASGTPDVLWQRD